MIKEDPITTIVIPPVDVVQFNCTHTDGVVSGWEVDDQLRSQNTLANGGFPGHNITAIFATNATGNAILVLDVIINDSRNGSKYVCVVPQTPPMEDIRSEPAFLIVAGKSYNIINLTCLSKLWCTVHCI